MTAIVFSKAGLRNAKRALIDHLPEQKSSHISEALAAACGYRTNAALLAALHESNPEDPDYVLLDDEAFRRRLLELNAGETLKLAFEGFEHLAYPSVQDVVATTSDRGRPVPPYRSRRSWAWRNAMVGATNAGIEQRLFTIRPGDNRWSGVAKPRSNGHVFRFSVGGIPALGYVSDAGYDELSIHVALWPSLDGESWIAASNAKFLAGESFAAGWVERRHGAWLQYSGAPSIACRRSRLAAVCALTLRPKGYADRGSFIM